MKSSLELAIEAYDERPWRAEPIYDLAEFYHNGVKHSASMLFIERGLKIPKPPDDVLFVEDYPYEYGFKNLATIEGFYAPDPAQKALGYDCCEELALSREAPVHLREQAWRNLFFYTRPLREQAPSCQLQRFPFTPPDGYHPLNPSICRVGDKMYLNVRAVNYLIGSDGRYVMPPDDVVRTRNFLFHLNDDLEALGGPRELTLPTDLPTPVFDLCLGFEDVRLFPIGDDLWCSATTRQIDPQGWCEIVVSRIGDDGQMRDWRVIHPEGIPRRAEKNWMPIIDHSTRWIYSCDPLYVIDVRGEVVDDSTPPIAATEFGGSSQAIPFDDGYLCLIHERQAYPDPMRGQRNYQRRFVWFDQNFNMRRISRRFTFTDGEGEFCCGMCWHPDGERLVISYGVLDREAWLATVNADEVRVMLRPVAGEDAKSQGQIGKLKEPVEPATAAPHWEVGSGSSDSIPVSNHIDCPDPGDRVGQPEVAVTPNIFECEAFSEDGTLKVRVAAGANDLGSLFRKYGTDKDVNGYTPFYEELFEAKRHDIKAVLEIGIGTMDPNAPYSMIGYAQPGYRPGGSLRAWRDWFQNAQIMGLDPQLDCQFNGVEERISTALADSTLPLKLPGREFDIIIDDGNHLLDAQLKTLANCLPLLREGGTYVIEDIVWRQSYASRLHEIVGPRPWRLSGPRDNLLIIEDLPWKAVGPDRVSPLGVMVSADGFEVPQRRIDAFAADPWLNSNTNAVLRSETDLQYAIDAVKHNGWPAHPDRTKNWDCYIAVRHVLKHAGRSECILDAGADRVSSFLPTLARLGYTDLTGINLLEISCEPAGPITYEYGNIENTGYPGSHFAFIACLSTIEHGVDVPLFLREMARILKPGGHLFISTDFWRDPIDTRIAGWQIFTPEGIMQIINAAADAGFVGITIPNFSCEERVCHHKGEGWGGSYTFLNLLFRKGAVE